jgi:hypothetical protein
MGHSLSILLVSVILHHIKRIIYFKFSLSMPGSDYALQGNDPVRSPVKRGSKTLSQRTPCIQGTSFRGRWNTNAERPRAIKEQKPHEGHKFISFWRILYRFYLNSSQRALDQVCSHRVYRTVISGPLTKSWFTAMFVVMFQSALWFSSIICICRV